MAHVLQIDQMKDCCGVYFLSNFRKNNNPESQTHIDHAWKRSHPKDWEYHLLRYQKDAMCETRQEYHERIRGRLRQHQKDLSGKKSYSLMILNSNEDEEIGHILREFCEVLIPMMRNPTGSAIVTYIMYHLPKEVKKQDSILNK